jgi:hypothetical protein
MEKTVSKPAVKAALERLIAVAKRDTGQSRRVANFLLAWWNATDNGGFDITDAWGLDDDLKTDMLYVFSLAISSHAYPDSLGYGNDFEEIWERWRATKAVTA